MQMSSRVSGSQVLMFLCVQNLCSNTSQNLAVCCRPLSSQRIICDAQGHLGIWFSERGCSQRSLSLSRHINAALSSQLLFDICFIKPRCEFPLIFSTAGGVAVTMNMEALNYYREKRPVCVFASVKFSDFVVMQSCSIMQEQLIAFSLVGHL